MDEQLKPQTGLSRFGPSDLLDAESLGVALGVTGRCVRQMVTRGDLPPGIILGGRKLWLVSRVVDFLHRRSEQAEAEQETFLAKVKASL